MCSGDGCTRTFFFLMDAGFWSNSGLVKLYRDLSNLNCQRTSSGAFTNGQNSNKRTHSKYVWKYILILHCYWNNWSCNTAYMYSLANASKVGALLRFMIFCVDFFENCPCVGGVWSFTFPTLTFNFKKVAECDSGRFCVIYLFIYLSLKLIMYVNLCILFIYCHFISKGAVLVWISTLQFRKYASKTLSSMTC